MSIYTLIFFLFFAGPAICSKMDDCNACMANNLYYTKYYCVDTGECTDYFPSNCADYISHDWDCANHFTCESYSNCGDCLDWTEHPSESCYWCADNTGQKCISTTTYYQFDSCAGRISTESNCPKEPWVPFAIIGATVGYMILACTCVLFCTRRDESMETPDCPECKHVTHHAYSICKVQIPNMHQSCSCYAVCKASVDPRIRHCGGVCGKTWVTVTRDSKGHTHTHHHRCQCVTCSCKWCSPTVDCGCRQCYCRQCNGYKYQSKIDRRWRYCRIPIGLAGFGIMLWGAITGYIFGIIWGVVMLIVIPFFFKRFDGCCWTPDKKHRVPSTENIWTAWDAAEEVATTSIQYVRDGSMVMGMGMQPMMMPMQGGPQMYMPMQGQPMPMQGQPMMQQGQPMMQQGQPMMQQGQPMMQQGQPMQMQGQPMYMPVQGQPMYAPAPGQPPMYAQPSGSGQYHEMQQGMPMEEAPPAYEDDYKH